MGGLGSVSGMGRGAIVFMYWLIGYVFYQKLCGNCEAYPDKGWKDLVSNHPVYGRYRLFNQFSKCPRPWYRSDHPKFRGSDRVLIGHGVTGFLSGIGEGDVWPMGRRKRGERTEKSNYFWCRPSGLVGT